MHLRRYAPAICLFPFFALAQSAPRPNESTIREWQSRKYGMFIHFGLFSVLGGVWKGKQYSGNYSEQIQSDAHIPETEYAALAAQFNPARWDPDATVRLAEDAGMKFIVLTAKHHDGFNMFATKQSTYNSLAATPYKRDIVKSLADACRRRGMPFGVYYSTIDWHFGDIPEHRNDNPISKAHEEFNVAQLRELLSQYGPISEIWFDMGHPTILQSRRFADAVHNLQSQCLISGRVWNSEGDFSETGDDAIPGYVTDEPWESPASIFSETWGYRSWQKRTPVNEKIQEHILRLVKVTSRGGNYILNIGPKGDGSVVEYEAEVLHGAGEWLRRHGEAIYGTTPQPFSKLDFGYATVKGDTLYLFVERLPADGRLQLPGLQNNIREAHWLNSENHGMLKVDETGGAKAVIVPAQPANDFLPVIKMTLAGGIKVQPTVTQPEPDGAIHLLAQDAERFFNNNGEGYYDPPTIRALRWNFKVRRAGKYRLEVSYKSGPFSRIVDITLAGKTLKANLYGRGTQSNAAETIDLAPSADLTLSIAPGSPAERGAKLDLEITDVSLIPLDPAHN